MPDESTAVLTRAEIEAVMQANASYRSDSTLVKVGLFIDAVEAWLTLPLSEFERGGERASIEVAILEKRLIAAIQWQANHVPSAAGRRREIYFDTSNFREI